MSGYKREPIRFKKCKAAEKRNYPSLKIGSAYKKIIAIEDDCKQAIFMLKQLRNGVRRGTLSKEYMLKKIEEIEEILKK